MPGPRLPIDINSINFQDHLALFDTYKPTLTECTALGYVAGSAAFSLFGQVTPVGPDDGIRVAQNIFNLVPTLPTVAPPPQLLSVQSNSAADTGIVFIDGIDANGDRQVEIIQAQGTTKVWSVNEFICTNIVRYDGLAGEYNVGEILIGDPFIESYTGAFVFPGTNYGSVAIFKVPNNHTVLINSLTLSASAKDGVVLFYSGVKIDSTSFSLGGPVSAGIAPVNIPLRTPQRLPEGSEWFMAVEYMRGALPDAFWAAEMVIYQHEEV